MSWRLVPGNVVGCEWRCRSRLLARGDEVGCGWWCKCRWLAHSNEVDYGVERCTSRKWVMSDEVDYEVGVSQFNVSG